MSSLESRFERQLSVRNESSGGSWFGRRAPSFRPEPLHRSDDNASDSDDILELGVVGGPGACVVVEEAARPVTPDADDDDFFCPANACADALGAVIDVEAMLGLAPRTARPTYQTVASYAASVCDNFARLFPHFSSASRAVAADIVTFFVERRVVETLLSAKIVAYAALLAAAKYYEPLDTFPGDRRARTRRPLDALVTAAKAGTRHASIDVAFLRRIEISVLRRLGFDVLSAGRALADGPHVVSP